MSDEPRCPTASGLCHFGFELRRGHQPRGFLFRLEAIDPTAVGTSTVRPMNDTKPNAFTALRNAFAALIGYPSNLDGSLTRRLQG